MYDKILLPLDCGNDAAQKKSLATAVSLAEINGSKIHVMTVVPDFGTSLVSSFFSEDHAKKMVEEASKKLQEIIDRDIPKSIQTKKIVAYGRIYSEIVEYANKNKVDLITMASHRADITDYLLGPNAAKVMRHAKCSVMIVRN